MCPVKTGVGRSLRPAPVTINGVEPEAATARRGLPASGNVPVIGLRERKKARLRQQIIETSLRMFRERGYDNTRIDDIVQALDISQPTFFRYFPSKDAVLREVGRRAFARQAERLKSELSSKATTAEPLLPWLVVMINTGQV